MSRTDRATESDTLGETIVAVAIVWAGVIIGSTVILQGTEYFSRLLPILGGGAAITIILLGILESNLRRSKRAD